MMNRTLIIIGFLLMTFSTFSQNLEFDIHKYKLAYFIKIEQGLGSKRFENKYNHSTLNGVAQPIIYRRKENKIPDLLCYYFYFQKDSTIYKILYEWDDNNFNGHEENMKKTPKEIEAFVDMYKKIYAQIFKVYGVSKSEGSLNDLSKIETGNFIKKDTWHLNDSTQIELATNLSSKYEKKFENNCMVTINPWYVIRLEIRDNSKNINFSFPLPDTIKVKKSKLNFVGIWELTNYNNPDEFHYVWEFKADEIFNELKKGYEQYHKDTLTADENGTWVFENNILTISVTNEMTNDVRKNYDKPQVMKFKASKITNDIILTVLDDGHGNKGKPMTLKLRKRVIENKSHVTGSFGQNNIGNDKNNCWLADSIFINDTLQTIEKNVGEDFLILQDNFSYGYLFKLMPEIIFEGSWEMEDHRIIKLHTGQSNVIKQYSIIFMDSKKMILENTDMNGRIKMILYRHYLNF